MKTLLNFPQFHTLFGSDHFVTSVMSSRCGEDGACDGTLARVTGGEGEGASSPLTLLFLSPLSLALAANPRLAPSSPRVYGRLFLWGYLARARKLV